MRLPSVIVDHHMHTIFSDGSATMEDMVRTAIEEGLDEIVFTDHMPLPYKPNYAMKLEWLDSYRNEIRRMQRRYQRQIDIYMGLEMETVPHRKEWTQHIVDMGWDCLIGSVHSMDVDGRPVVINGALTCLKDVLTHRFEGDFSSLCRHYYHKLQTAIASEWFDIVGHLDVIKKHNVNNCFFAEFDDWYQDLVYETLGLISLKGLTIEINTAGLNHPIAEQYPSWWIIEAAKQQKIPLVLSSDAHRPSMIGTGFMDILDLFQENTFAFSYPALASNVHDHI
jgi:histidinol-phosphatase (PHP family)